MRIFINKQTLIVLLLSIALFAKGQQKYDIRMTQSESSLEDKTLSGHTTTFDFSKASVKKGWWKYAREFGHPLDMRTYYKITVPSSNTDGNVDVVIYTQIEAVDSGVSFFLGTEEKEFETQTKILLLDFKKYFYINSWLDTIEQKKIQAKELSVLYKHAFLESERESLLDKIIAIKTEMDTLQEEIKDFLHLVSL